MAAHPGSGANAQTAGDAAFIAGVVKPADLDAELADHAARLADLKIVGTLFLEQARDLWPFYLGGVLFAAFIKTFKWDRRIRASLVRYGRSSILVAVAAGLISPLCSCGILPVVIALSAAGVPLPPVMALLITSPLMSPDAFLITVGQLGWTYALWKLAAAAVIGLSAGFGAAALVRSGHLDAQSFRAGNMYSEGGKVRPGFEDIVRAGCFSHAGEPGAVVDRENRLVFFLERSRDMGLLVGKFLVLALMIQAVVTYYVPMNLVEPVLGRKSALSPGARDSPAGEHRRSEVNPHVQPGCWRARLHFPESVT